MTETPQWALQKIQEAVIRRTNTLDLSYSWTSDELPLQEIPIEITSVPNLQSLILEEQDILTLPDHLLRLKNLRELVIWGDFRVIPEWIGRLSNLSTLYLRGQFDEIPTSISNLRNLENLFLLNDDYEEGYAYKLLPREFSRLHQLRKLYIKGSISILPDWIGELRQLTELSIQGLFDSVPNTIANLDNLQSLVLYGQLTRIPDSIFKLNNLVELDLYDNPISEISSKILKLYQLEDIDFQTMNLQNPPAEIFGTNNKLEALRSYFSGIEEQEDHVYESKVLILGEGGAGKTTLTNKIINPEYALNSDEPTTEGIQVTKWLFSFDTQKEFQVNLWDFGGQEIYHSTHQFFLTQRSLYIIIADMREENTDFYYWLNIVELLSGDSPVLIVKNEKQERSPQIGAPQLRERFANIKDIISCNLATNRGLPKIIDSIKFHTKHLPHVGYPLPKSWVDIRHFLEGYPQNYITIENYRHICQQFNISDSTTQDVILGFLHDLGICLYFPDDSLLKKWVILKPQWGTFAVYAVLDNKEVQNNFGRFSKSELEIIWNHSQYIGMHEELLSLMRKFKLCYAIPDEQGKYIAPQLLSEDRPLYRWNGVDDLYIKYQYKFMPKGILTRLIVLMHRFIRDDLVWKTGVILTYERADAEVIENYEQKEIHVKVSGYNGKVLLSIIMYELSKIHASFYELHVDRLLPCNCSECKQSDSPHFYTYNALLGAIQRFTEIQCLKTYNMINPESLVNSMISKSIARADVAKSPDVGRSLSFNIFMDEQNNISTGEYNMTKNDNSTNIDVGGNVANLNTGTQEGTFTINTGTFNNAPQSDEMTELKALFEDLQTALNDVPQEQAEEAEAVAELANSAVELATQEKPNKTMLKVTGEGLKQAAANLLDVAPIAVKIAAILTGITA